jgi:fatty acid desaturase
MIGLSADERAAAATTRADIVRLHDFEHWPASRLWPMLVLSLVLGIVTSLLPLAYWPLLFVLWPAMGTVIFVFLLAFHDASHERLHPVRWMNEAYGHIVGSLMFIPLNVFRYTHARHHASLGAPNDPELWPFNLLEIPRSIRVMAAFGELVFGFLYTPLLFFRSVAVGQLSSRERARIVRGYVACLVTWAAIFSFVYYFDLWRLFLITAVVPMMISGQLQSLTKFTQHLGLHGHTVLGLTRTIVDRRLAAELISSAMFYGDYHGTHHRYAKIPYYNLPPATPFALRNAKEECPVFHNRTSALVDMLPCLADPKVGPQWIDGTQ